MNHVKTGVSSIEYFVSFFFLAALLPEEAATLIVLLVNRGKDKDGGTGQTGPRLQ